MISCVLKTPLIWFDFMSSEVTQPKFRSLFSVNVDFCYNKLDFSLLEFIWTTFMILLLCFFVVIVIVFFYRKKLHKDCKMSPFVFHKSIYWRRVYFLTIFNIFRSHDHLNWDKSVKLLKQVSRFQIWCVRVRLNLNALIQLREFCFPLPVWIKCRCNLDSFQTLSKEISQPTE